ncbi:UbiA family prenyltransferase [Nocardioides lijunqiniae]|uniref:UbiA family prenyltransferase n=1 Tax=Nocardioides lijunqiniae TaxID=2760832 RepID=UPI00187828EA|nr:UbiA family prenyltransferase [Nocardioides lijunqiniae]
MAKTQRWRRRSPAEESAVDATVETAVEEPQEGATLTETKAAEKGAASAEATKDAADAEAEDVEDPEDVEEPAAPRTGRPRLTQRAPLTLIQAAHPRQAVLTAAFVAVAAALSGRAAREVAVVAATVLVGQAILGWHNDLTDRRRDARHETPGKPVAQGHLDPGTAWFALTCGVLLVVPLSITSGVTAGGVYLLSLVVGLLGNVALRQGLLSWLPWALSYGLLPAYLSYGGWGGEFRGDAPNPVLTLLFALLGVGVHFLRALWGLVPDHEDGWTYLPLRLGLKLGATRLLVLAGVYSSLVLVLIAFTGSYSGLAR